MAADPSYVTRVILIKFPASMIVLRVVSIEGYVIPPHIIQQGLPLNAAYYTDVLETVGKLWIDRVCRKRAHVFLQASASAHKVVVTHH